MTEQEWLAGANVTAMKRYIVGKISERKRRLFGCACCRRIWHLLPDERSQRAVEVSERFADGPARHAELKAARQAALAVAEVGVRQFRQMSVRRAAQAAARSAQRNAIEAGWGASDEAARAAADFAYFGLPHGPGGGHVGDWHAAFAAEQAEQAALLRDLVGNPFRQVVPEPAWLLWGDGTAVKIAQSIYEGRRFQDLPVLADALEEAGCAEAELLAHCRGCGEHARGCWAVDLVLGRR
jgi:hypothetical protein